MMKEVVDAGINFIDTANAYSYGESEKLLGQSIKDLGLHRNELIIATKVRARMNDKPNSVGLSRYHIFNSVDESLQRLQMDHIDMLYVHGVDYYASIEEIMHTFNDIVQTGKVRYIAVSNWPAWMVMKAQAIADKHGWHKFVGLQYYYSLASRDIEREILPLATEEKLGVIPWSPFAGGFLSGKYTRDNQKAGNSRMDDFIFPPIDKEKAFNIIDVIAAIGKDHNVPAAQIALAWVRQQPGVTSTIIGAKRLDQLKDNLHSTQITLAADELQRIDKVSALVAEYPEWAIQFLEGDRK